MQAMNGFNTRLSSAVLVGDSTTDMEAARAAGIECIGYANKPGKAEPFSEAGARTVITTLDDLVAALCAPHLHKADKLSDPGDP